MIIYRLYIIIYKILYRGYIKLSPYKGKNFFLAHDDMSTRGGTLERGGYGYGVGGSLTATIWAYPIGGVWAYAGMYVA